MAPPIGKTHADGADSTICYYGTTYGCACADNLYIRADQLLCREATDSEVTTAFKAVMAIAKSQLRKLIIESLIMDLPDKCEWGYPLKDYPCFKGEDGYVDYKSFPKEALYNLPDEVLLSMYDSNACRRYR